MPLPGAGTSTAFLSSVRPTHCSTSRASRSTSSSDFSGYAKKERDSIRMEIPKTRAATNGCLRIIEIQKILRIRKRMSENFDLD